MASRIPNEPIKVFLRVRPLNEFEETSGCNTAVKFLDKTRISIRDDSAGEFQTDLDSIFDSTSDQEAVYNRTCASVPQQLLEGFDCAIFTYGASGTGKTYSILGGETPTDRIDKRLAQAEEGIIPRLARDIFNSIQSSDSAIEYTVRCSVVEIYLDRLRDLLVESCHVRAAEGKLRGCSRLSCLSADDIVDIAYRAHAARTSSAIDSCRESSRSSMIVQVEIEQYDSRSESVKASTLLVCDLVGSELSNTPTEGSGNETRAKVSKSLNVLKRLAEERRNGVPVTMPITAPPLSQLLSPYLGGSSHTTILLTGSISDIASKETIETVKFGEICRSIRNAPAPNVHERWQDCSVGLMEAREINHRLEDLVKVLANECHRLQSKSGARFSSTTLEFVISDINDAAAEHRDIKFTFETKAEHQIRTEQMKLKSETRRAVQTRDDLQSAVAQMQTDLQVLKDQNIRLLEGKETAEAEIARLKNELLVTHALKTEAEHNLRTSQFRESEAVVFARQLRRFYFRLRKKMAADGSGDISQIVQQVPGAPGLEHFVDIDNLMVESGLLEQHEIGGDISPHSKASPEAMTRSAGEAHKMISAANDNSIAGQSDEIIPTPKSAVVRENPQSIEARQRLYRTPAGKYLEMRENALEAELMSLSEKASQLAKDLAEEKEKVETLTKNIGVAAALDRLKNVKETKVVKDQLEKKEHDLNAVIWKMNELHTTGKSLQAMLSERDSRILYLEKSFNEASSRSVSLARDKEQGDKSLREEVASLVTRLRRFSAPVRYFGEPSTADTPLQFRLVTPFASSNTVSKAGINAVRRASIGETGEWITVTCSAEKTNAQTQTFTADRNEGQTQTEMKEAKDGEAQTEVRNVDVLVDAETQTDVAVGTHGGFVASDAETQTEGILLTLKDIELSTIEAAASSVSTEANVDDLLFMVTNREESFENSQIPLTRREPLKTSVVRNDEFPTSSLSANAFLFMEDENMEDALEQTKPPLQNDHATAIVASGSHLRSSSVMSLTSNQDANKALSDTTGSNHSHFSGTSMNKDDNIATPGNTTIETVLERHPGEGDKAPEKGETPEPTRNDEKDPLPDAVPEEPKSTKPVSSFLAKLQAQARKKQAEQANDTIEKDTVPEFMKKFKTIGARNANESVIETSGESSSRQPNFGGMRVMETTPSIPWHPRKKSDDDDSESDEGNRSNTALSEKTSAVESVSYPAKVVGQGSSMTAPSSEVDEGSDASSESAPGPSSLPKGDDDSDSDSSSDENEEKPEAPLPTPGPSLLASDSHSSSDEDEPEKKPEAPVPTPGPSSLVKGDASDSHSSSDEDEPERKPEAPLPTPGPLSLAKGDDDSDSSSSSDEDEPEKKPEPPVPAPGPSSVTKGDDDSDSHSNSDGDEKKPEAPVPTPGPSSLVKGDASDSHSSSDEDEPERKPETPLPTPGPSSLAKGNDDSDSQSSSDEDEADKKPEPPVPAPGPSSVTKGDDDSDSHSSSDEGERERKPDVQVPTPGSSSLAKGGDDESDSNSSSDEDESERKPPLPTPGPSSLAKGDDDSDSQSSSDEDEDEADKKPEAPVPTPRPSSLAKGDDDSDSSSSSDEDEEEHQPAAQGTAGKAAALKANNEAISRVPTQKARKEQDDSDVSSSSDASDQSSEDESTKKGSEKMLQGGKSTDFKPTRKVTDFGANVSPALSPKKPAIKTKKKSEKDGKSKTEASTKPSTKSSKPVKGKTSKEPTKSSTKPTTDTKSSKFAVRGSDIVLADDGEWGKSASKKSAKGKSTFVIKNGKLVKNEAASPPPSKIEKPAFKIVGGKLVKQGKGDGETKKSGGKSGRSRMGEI